MEDFIKQYWPFLAAIAILLYLLDVCNKDKATARKATGGGGADEAPINNTTPPAQQPLCQTFTNADGSTYTRCI